MTHYESAEGVTIKTEFTTTTHDGVPLVVNNFPEQGESVCIYIDNWPSEFNLYWAKSHGEYEIIRDGVKMMRGWYRFETPHDALLWLAARYNVGMGV